MTMMLPPSFFGKASTVDVPCPSIISPPMTVRLYCKAKPSASLRKLAVKMNGSLKFGANLGPVIVIDGQSGILSICAVTASQKVKIRMEMKSFLFIIDNIKANKIKFKTLLRFLCSGFRFG